MQDPSLLLDDAREDQRQFVAKGRPAMVSEVEKQSKDIDDRTMRRLHEDLMYHEQKTFLAHRCMLMKSKGSFGKIDV